MKIHKYLKGIYMNTPLIKWTGSKRHIAPKIISYFPSKIETYHEPFLGGGSVFIQLLKSNHDVKHFELSDKNDSLIDIFKLVKDSPTELANAYQNKWQKLQDDRDFYYIEREHYNKTKDPLSFYFLTRTCYNGTIRYNSLGDFNTSYHLGRAGMHPSKAKQAILYYHEIMKGRDITLKCNSFDAFRQFDNKDVVYLDPPYTNTKALYFGNISLPLFLNWVDTLPCSWFMNINGVNATDNEENISIPYTNKEILSSGKSSFSRMKGKDISVGEYFYYKLLN